MAAKTHKLVRYFLLALLPIALLVGWQQRWYVHDQLRLRSYTPTPRIEKLVEETTMNDYGRRIFYVYYPEIDTKAAFNKNCRSSERTIVLGCYVDGKGIYLYEVVDERLDGVLQVTAAHEMLHAAYGRLSGSEKARINRLLTDAFAQVTNERVRSTIEDYRKHGADINNELHSILGSEIRDLPAELNAYYARYFTNRMAVVAYSERYEKAFTDRKNQVAVYDKQLDELRIKIDSSQAELDVQSDNLTRDRNQLNSLLASRQYAEYNAGVAPFNAAVSRYNSLVRTVRAQIDEYNRIVAARNDIVVEEGELVKAIEPSLVT